MVPPADVASSFGFSAPPPKENPDDGGALSFVAALGALEVGAVAAPPKENDGGSVRLRCHPVSTMMKSSTPHRKKSQLLRVLPWPDGASFVVEEAVFPNENPPPSDADGAASVLSPQWTMPVRRLQRTVQGSLGIPTAKRKSANCSRWRCRGCCPPKFLQT